MKKWRLLRKGLSATLAVCVLLVGIFVGNVFVNAAELAGFQDLSVVCFRNVGSGKYLSIHNGTNANSINVYQTQNVTPDSCFFQLQYNVAQDCYRLAAECSKNSTRRYLDIANGALSAGSNVQIYMTGATNRQSWQFYYYGEGRFTIVAKANQQLALTTNSTSEGTADGKTAGSPGNIYLYPLQSSSSNVNPYQLWEIVEIDLDGNPYNDWLIDEGYYKFQNEYGKYMETNSATQNVYHNSGSNNGQFWRIDHAYGGYYAIRPAIDHDSVLCVSDNFDEMGSNIETAYLGTASPPTAAHMLWKIIPNADGVGSYRIVSMSSYDNQVVTVLYDDEDGANIAQVDYVNAPSQRWALSLATCPSYGYPDHAEGHVLDFVEDGYDTPRYECGLCNVSFMSPQEQDRYNNFLTDEDRVIIFALQRAAMLKQLEEGKSHFVEACYQAVDLIRSECDGYYEYDFSHRDGSYMSPFQYTYDADTIDASIRVDSLTYGDMRQLTHQIVWTAGSNLPFPLSLYSNIMLDYLEDKEFCTWTDLLYFLGEAFLGEVSGNIIETLDKDLAKAITYAGLYNSTMDVLTNPVSFDKDIVIEIAIYDGEHYDTFGGTYRMDINSDSLIYILDESYSVYERTATNFVPNEFDRYYDLDSGYAERSTFLFPV